VELNREPGVGRVDNSLVALIVFIGEQRLPTLWQGCDLGGKAVVLRRDETLGRAVVRARLVVPAVSVP
jgi:hypothetical protein